MRAALLGTVLTFFLSSLALAEEPPRPEAGETDATMGRKVQELLRAHGNHVHDCYSVALAERPGLTGEVLVRLFVGESGAVEKAEVLKDQTGSRRLTDCLAAAMRSWRAPDLASGGGVNQIVFPLVFKPEEARADAAKQQENVASQQSARPAAGRPRFVVPLKEGKPGPIGKGKVEARVLVDEQLVGPTKASLTHLTLHPTARLALHLHPGTMEIFYVLRGMARVRDGTGAILIANAGDVMVAPALVPHSIESAPLAPVTALQLFVPAGPEHGYRDPTDHTGTVAAHKPVAVPHVPERPVPRVIVIHPAEAKTYPILGGKGEATLLLDGAPPLTGPLEGSLQRFEAQAGAAVPTHTHDCCDEVLFILSGRAEMTVGGETIPVAANDAIHIPTGIPHALKVLDKLTAIQCYGPAGPEQRFKPQPK